MFNPQCPKQWNRQLRRRLRRSRNSCYRRLVPTISCEPSARDYYWRENLMPPANVRTELACGNVTDANEKSSTTQLSKASWSIVTPNTTMQFFTSNKRMRCSLKNVCLDGILRARS